MVVSHRSAGVVCAEPGGKRPIEDCEIAGKPASRRMCSLGLCDLLKLVDLPKELDISIVLSAVVVQVLWTV